MGDEPEDKDLHRYSATYALDRDGFFRRVCPSCGRGFKVKATPEDLAYSLQVPFGEIGPDIGEATEDEGESESRHIVYCPYCGFRAQQSEAIPGDLSLYLKRWAIREMVLPKLRQMSADLERSFRSPRAPSRGLVSVSTTFTAEDSSLPPRPIAGPEAPDMRTVDLACCHNQVKILDGWRDTITCPFCGEEAALQ